MQRPCGTSRTLSRPSPARPVYAAGIIAELGNLARFDHDEAKVAQYAGLHRRQKQSARKVADDTRLTNVGRLPALLLLRGCQRRPDARR